MNLIPKSGGNRFKGSAFYSGAGRWSTGDNLNDTLRSSYGLSQPAGVITSWDADDRNDEGRVAAGGRG